MHVLISQTNRNNIFENVLLRLKVLLDLNINVVFDEPPASQ